MIDIEKIRFGPAGNSDSFYLQGYKSSTQMPKWLFDKGLSAYEYSCGRGVNIKQETAVIIGEEAKKYDVALSIHAPYYINLSSLEPDKQEASKRYALEALQAAQWMSAARVVFHPGACKNMDRLHALNIAKESLKELLQRQKEMDLNAIKLCPETMGKKNQLGTLDEVLALCKLSDDLIPALDFGHINALGNGAIKTQQDYSTILNQIENTLGADCLRKIHIHFSRIEYTQAGEKKHWTLADTQYGPEFDPLAELLYKKAMRPIVICESRGTMAEDAISMKGMYETYALCDNL